MTDFVAETRHYCRNPRCRSKLPAPVANAREAFCTRGCHSGFYRTRCLVCEAKMERRTENQLICGKRRCRNALQARQSLGRYHAPYASPSSSRQFRATSRHSAIHSITSSASNSPGLGMTRPRLLAVLRLTANSNFVLGPLGLGQIYIHFDVPCLPSTEIIRARPR